MLVWWRGGRGGAWKDSVFRLVLMLSESGEGGARTTLHSVLAVYRSDFGCELKKRDPWGGFALGDLEVRLAIYLTAKAGAADAVTVSCLRVSCQRR